MSLGADVCGSGSMILECQFNCFLLFLVYILKLNLIAKRHDERCFLVGSKTALVWVCMSISSIHSFKFLFVSPIYAFPCEEKRVFLFLVANASEHSKEMKGRKILKGTGSRTCFAVLLFCCLERRSPKSNESRREPL